MKLVVSNSISGRWDSERRKESKILITEDEKVIAECVAELLQQKGYLIVGNVDTGEEAIEVARTSIPDVVIMDVNLKGQLNGIEAASAILSFNPQTKIIFFSAVDRELFNFISVSPYEYIHKPFSNEDLLQAIERCLGPSTK